MSWEKLWRELVPPATSYSDSDNDATWQERQDRRQTQGSGTLLPSPGMFYVLFFICFIILRTFILVITTPTTTSG
ncbi:hypothetical protein L208DRAFT_1402822 [Tricholoma matsutake]|nr:hypothetical protein L208DRAFT_1402822 [Tricholoma matsutake 945]